MDHYVSHTKSYYAPGDYQQGVYHWHAFRNNKSMEPVILRPCTTVTAPLCSKKRKVTIYIWINKTNFFNPHIVKHKTTQHTSTQAWLTGNQKSTCPGADWLYTNPVQFPERFDGFKKSRADRNWIWPSLSDSPSPPPHLLQGWTLEGGGKGEPV